MIARRYLHSLRLRQVDTLVLGCTHYPLLKKVIQPRIGKRVRLIDSSEAVARDLATHLSSAGGMTSTQPGGGLLRAFVSDLTESARSMARLIFGRPVELEQVDLAEGKGA